MIAEKDPAIKKAVNKLTILSEDERNQMIYDYKERARMDANARESFVRNQGRAEGMAQAKQVFKYHYSGKSTEEIASLCNLSLDEVKEILS